MIIDKHVDGFLSLIPSGAGLPSIFTEKIPDDTDPESNPYVRLYFDHSWLTRNFPGRSHEFQLTVTAHCVGGSDLAARRVTDWLEAQILDKTPVVPGRSCRPVRHDSGSPPRPDESTGRSVLDQVNVYVLRSVPAS